MGLSRGCLFCGPSRWPSQSIALLYSKFYFNIITNHWERERVLFYYSSIHINFQTPSSFSCSFFFFLHDFLFMFFFFFLVAKMRMLRWIYGKTGKDRIRDEHIWKHLGTASIGDKLRDSFEILWTCPTQTHNGASEDNFLYAGWWCTPGKMGRPKRT